MMLTPYTGVFLSAVLFLGMAFVLSAPLGAQSVTVGLQVPISPIGVGKDSGSILASPEDPQQLIACGMRVSSADGSWQGFVYKSVDGGAHWATALIDATIGHLVSEESCAFGPDGSAYFIAETWNHQHEWPQLGGGIVRFYRSLDAGRTWAPTLIDSTPASWMDYAQIGVDLTRGPYRGRVYVFSNAYNGRWLPGTAEIPSRPMRYSIDGGLHFSDRVTLPLVHVPNGGGFPQTVIVLPTGTVVAAYANRETKNGVAYTADNQQIKTLIQVARSTDGGHTLSVPITVTEGDEIGFPSMALDTSAGPFRGRLYLVFTDKIARTSRTMLTTSDDQGATWTESHVVDDWNRLQPRDLGKPGSPAWQWPGTASPRIAVNRDGVLGVSWDEDGCSRFGASLDGGRTFLPSVPLNLCPRREGTTFPIGMYMSARAGAYNVDKVEGPDFQRRAFTILVNRYRGGNMGLTADTGGAFHAAFSISGYGGLWTTRVTVNRTGLPAAQSLATTHGLADISSRVTFTFTELDYDAGTGLITVELSLINMESVPIRSPLRVELTRLGSTLFQHLEVVNADNHVAGLGAVWDLSASLPGGVLGAYATTAPRRLVFRLTDGPQPVDFRIQPSVPLLVADVKICGAQ